MKRCYMVRLWGKLQKEVDKSRNRKIKIKLTIFGQQIISIRIISFSGKRDDWRVWSRKFLAVAEKRGYKKVLTGALLLTSTSSTEDKQLGINAYNNLLLAMTETISFGLVDESKSTICPDGDARKAWDKLMKRFESKTSASKVKLMGQLHASKLTKKSKDPEV